METSKEFHDYVMEQRSRKSVLLGVITGNKSLVNRPESVWFRSFLWDMVSFGIGVTSSKFLTCKRTFTIIEINGRLLNKGRGMV